MTNAQSNLAALGTKPIQFNLGEIYLNQMNYLAKTKGEEEAARAKARAERAKDVGDFSAKQSALDYKNVPDYVLSQYNQSFNDAIEDNNRITRELQAGLIDQTEAGRQYAKNKNIPEQVAAFAESVKTSYEQMRDGKGDPILNAEREAFLKNIASGGFALKRGEDGTQQVYLKDPDGTEKPYSMSEVGMKLNTEWKFYDKEYDTEDYAKSLADNAKTIKTDTGYIQSEKVSFANSKDAIKKAIKSSVSSFSEYDNWSPEIKKAYKEKNGIYARPKDEKEVDDFIEDFTDKRVRVHFKEVDSTGNDPLMTGKLAKQNLDIEGARLGNQGKRISNAKNNLDLKKAQRDEADDSGANTKIELGGINLGKDQKTGKEKLIHTTLFTPTKPIQYKVGDKEGGAIYNVSSFHVDRDGYAYIPNDQIGVATEGVTKVNMTSDQSFLANALKLGTGENMRGIAKEFLDKERPIKKPSTIDRIKNTTNNVLERVKTFAGNKQPRTPDDKQSNKMIRMSVNGQPYDVPADKVSALLKKYPKAKRL